jgi:CubicO group peptidase (beta-lactamase class C family)
VLIAADRHFQSLPTLASVLVLRRGRLVFERYYHGATADQNRNIFSVTKSVVSALVGIALHDGDLRSLDQRLVDFFPEKLEGSTDADVRTITLRDLLTMTAGYRSEPVFTTDDWVRTLMNRPLASVPGVTWAYDDGSAHLLSAVLTKVTGMSLESFARRRLFEPLGIRPGPWTSDGQGYSLGSTGLHLRPGDLLALGRLFLQEGKWNGRQIVPAEWVHASTATQASIPGSFAYGYLWWVNTGPHKGYLAQGALGQVVAVYPRYDVVIAITGAGDFDRLDVLDVLLRAVAR